MAVYECWIGDDGTDITLTSPEIAADHRERGLIPADAVLAYSFEADTYNEAMQMHYDRQGWGTYHPMHEEPPKARVVEVEDIVQLNTMLYGGPFENEGTKCVCGERTKRWPCVHCGRPDPKEITR